MNRWVDEVIMSERHKKLLVLERALNVKFIEVKQGTPCFLSTGKEIPAECVYYRTDALPDGLYKASENTCGGPEESACTVGYPAEKCVTSGVYSPGKCARYIFYPIDDVTLHVSVDQLLSLMEVVV
jgi:hypothetical protein